MKKQVKKFNDFINESYDIPEGYDYVLDRYNKYGTTKMWDQEIDFLKSGGKLGGQPWSGIDEDLVYLYEEVFDYLDQSGIKYLPTTTWAPSFGVMWGMEMTYSRGLEATLKRMFEQAPAITNEASPDYVMKYECGSPQYGEGETLMIWVFDPTWYKDIRKFGGKGPDMCSLY